MTKLFIALCALSVLTLSGCGFALRGTGEHLQVAPQYQTVQLVIDDNPTAFALKQALNQHLTMLGVRTGTSTNRISISNLRFHRYKLVGTLTEIRLVLMADVRYETDGNTKSFPLQVERHYQYNEASVATADTQGEVAQTWLYDHLAQRIAEQYRSISTP